ncbi:MAG: ABC transporter substrate binding protein [Gammaproteobacteria bacterium]|nr:ABC transporter substrate binding protein [Gammaproteobacteria bacterium]
MKEHTCQQRIYRDCFQFIALLWLLFLPMVAAASESVLIIKSNDNRYFSTSIEQIINNVSGNPRFNISTPDSIDPAQISPDKVDLIITLGADAADYSTGIEQDIPIIHSYITAFQHQHADNGRKHYSLFLEQPLARYIHFIKLLLAPEAVAVIQPDQQQISKQEIKSLQDKFALTINQEVFVEGDNPIKVVRNLLADNDVLLSLPAPEIYNNKSLKGILLSSYRQQKPVISYSPSHVRSGALASIYTSPADIGKQIAILANQILHARPPTRTVYHADKFNILINQQVAQSLGLQLPDSDRLQRQLIQAEQR